MSINPDSVKFSPLGRQEFRRVFQPSRIVMGIFGTDESTSPNVITLCFDMYCSYKPPMMAFAIQQGAYSYQLLTEAQECVLAVPGDQLANEALFCGLKSGHDVDKVKECNLELVESKTVGVPGLQAAIANIEMRIVSKVKTGDHLTAFGEILRFSVNEDNSEKCLLSVGPNENGYRVLARQGIQRVAVVDQDLDPNPLG